MKYLTSILNRFFTKEEEITVTEKFTLEARLAQLKTEQVEIQKEVDTHREAAATTDRLFNDAQRRHDLEGDDAAAPLMTQYRNGRDEAVTRQRRAEAILSEFPARYTAIQTEIGNVDYRSDLQLLAKLKIAEAEAFALYATAAIAVVDAHAILAVTRADRERVFQRVDNYARAHSLPYAASGNFDYPTIDSWWGTPSLIGHLREKIADTKRGLPK